MDGPPGRIEFRFAQPDVIELVWSGYMNLAAMETYPTELRRMLIGRNLAYALFDASAVTGFAADSRGPGGELLAECKRKGAKRTFVVTQSSPIRMIGSAVAVAVGLSIRFHETRQGALNAIADMRAKN
jgi:hypothetical protein